MIRTSTFRVAVAPSRWISPPSRARRSFTCRAGSSSPISSRRRVPGVGELETAGLGLRRAGEGALLVAEELAFNERRGQGGAVYRDERPVAPRAVRVERAGEQFLAGAGLAEEQDGRVRVGDLPDLLQSRPEGRASPDDLTEVVGLVELRVEIDVLGLQALAETPVFLQGQTEGALDIPVSEGAREDLAHRVKRGDPVRRPTGFRRGRGERDGGHGPVGDPSRRERA